MKTDTDTFQAYTLFECGQFLLHRTVETVTAFCPTCGAGPVTGQTFPEAITMEEVREIVKGDVRRLFTLKRQPAMRAPSAAEALRARPRRTRFDP